MDFSQKTQCTYEYDAAGQLLRQYSEASSKKANDSIEHRYTYDPQGNVLTQYRSGAGGQDRFNLAHTYDALNRLTKTTGDQGYKGHEYTYDSLGNLTYELIHNKGNEYWYNSLNQQVVHKDYVLDYTSPLKNVVMEYESGAGGLTYRYVHSLQKTSVTISGIPNGAGSVMQYVYDDEEGEFVLTTEKPGQNISANGIVKLWYHRDRLGSDDYLTDNVAGKVTSYVTYDDWGMPTAKAVLRMGVREE